jgi:hypothetical protein
VPRGTLKLKKKEFSDLNQGGVMVNEYLNLFIQLSRYATDDINTDEKKQDTFSQGSQGQDLVSVAQHRLSRFLASG